LQTFDDVAPLIWEEYFFAEHSIFEETPSLHVNPTGQIIHVLEFVASFSKEYVPAAHKTGCVIPEFAQKLPIGHGWQKPFDSAPFVAENVPGGHNSSPIDARAQNVPALHSIQLLLCGWLLFAEKVPAGHGMGSEDPSGQ
jgi:hypothetical protein